MMWYWWVLIAVGAVGLWALVCLACLAIVSPGANHDNLVEKILQEAKKDFTWEE